MRFPETVLDILKPITMQKVYLLLRDNQQTGPFSLEELIRFDLKPFDLIWIEGKSAGWYYPQEIQALQPHLCFLKQPTTQPPSSPLVDIKNKPAENSVQPKKSICVHAFPSYERTGA